MLQFILLCLGLDIVRHCTIYRYIFAIERLIDIRCQSSHRIQLAVTKVLEIDRESLVTCVSSDSSHKSSIFQWKPSFPSCNIAVLIVASFFVSFFLAACKSQPAGHAILTRSLIGNSTVCFCVSMLTLSSEQALKIMGIGLCQT